MLSGTRFKRKKKKEKPKIKWGIEARIKVYNEERPEYKLCLKEKLTIIESEYPKSLLNKKQSWGQDIAIQIVIFCYPGND